MKPTPEMIEAEKDREAHLRVSQTMNRGRRLVPYSDPRSAESHMREVILHLMIGSHARRIGL